MGWQALAQEPGESDVDQQVDELKDLDAAAADSAFRAELDLWIWLFGITGDVGVRGTKTHVDASLQDIAENSDSIMAFSGRLEIGYDRFTGFVDGTYANIGVENASGPAGLGKIDITNEVGIVDFGLMYRVLEWPGEENGAKGSLDAYAGGRYLTLDLELDPENAASRSGGRDWVDPIIGAKLRQPITKDFHLDMWGDVGGFGVESDLTWSATALIGLDFDLFSMPATLYGGYRAIGWEHTEGSGSSKFIWDAVFHGPTLGLGIRF